MIDIAARVYRSTNENGSLVNNSIMSSALNFGRYKTIKALLRKYSCTIRVPYTDGTCGFTVRMCTYAVLYTYYMHCVMHGGALAIFSDGDWDFADRGWL